MSADVTCCGFVAVIGAPNAGKSTLINTIVGSKVSIVSAKVQTTRTKVLGITIQDQSQIIFIDTPGIFEPDKKVRLERAMVASALETIGDADAIMLLVDASKKISGDTRIIIERLQDVTKPRLLVLNKTDKIEPQRLLALAAELNSQCDFEATFMVSALKGDGVSDLVKNVAKILPEGPWHYPEDEITDMPMRLMSAEVTREKLFNQLHQELPYNLTVETENWEEFDDGSIKIDQTIFIAREQHKKIILGKGGSMIKKIGETSRKEIETITGTRVHLKLFVKVRENWQEESERFQIWGLDFGA